MRFKYLLDKIENANILLKPFPHLAIKNFFKKTHLELLLNNRQIHFGVANDFTDLTKRLKKTKYHLQAFPGCTTLIDDYLAQINLKNNPVETYGLCYRLELEDIIDKYIVKIITFLNSKEFENAIKNKFRIIESTICFTAIQKHLDKYQISPHPDIRSKCLTYLLSINAENYEGQDTALFQFKKQYEDVYKFWGQHEHLNRFWVPRNWCNQRKIIKENNTLLLFSTSNYSLHGIKLDYNHLISQRTQIYGNLMYKNPVRTKHISYQEYLKSFKL